MGIIKNISGEYASVALSVGTSSDVYFTNYGKDALGVAIKTLGYNFNNWHGSSGAYSYTIKLSDVRKLEINIATQEGTDIRVGFVKFLYYENSAWDGVDVGGFVFNKYFSTAVLLDEDSTQVIQIGDLDVTSTPFQPNNYYWNVSTFSGIFNTKLHKFFDGITDSNKYPTHGTPDDGGDGTRDNSSDDIDVPDNPDISASATGFITIYKPSFNQLHSFGQYLWSDDFNIDNFKKIFADPWDGIIGLSLVPLDVPTSGSRLVKVGNAETNISMSVVGNQFVEVSCGSLTISEYSGTYLDYAPYTQIDIYLPFIGIRKLDTDTVMGKTISVTYKVDVISGSCIAFIKCSDSVLYSFTGSCSLQLPITATNFNSVIMSAVNIGTTSIGGAIAGGLAGGIGGAITGAVGGGLTATASNVGNMKGDVTKSGSCSGSCGIMGIQYPYIIIKRPNDCIPPHQNEFIGYPTYWTVTLGDLSGYTEVDSIHLENISATDGEKAEIERLLKGGVII